MLIKNPSFYLFGSKYPRRKNYTKGFIKLLGELNIHSYYKSSCTRYEYDDSDNTSWILYYGEAKESKLQLEIDKEKLKTILYDEQPVFNVSGNGYGTGLSIMLNYNKIYK